MHVGAAYDLAQMVINCTKAGLEGPEGLAGVPRNRWWCFVDECWHCLYLDARFCQRTKVLLPGESKPVWLEKDAVPAVYRSCGLPAGSIILGCECELKWRDPVMLHAMATVMRRRKAASQPRQHEALAVCLKTPVKRFLLVN